MHVCGYLARFTAAKKKRISEDCNTISEDCNTFPRSHQLDEETLLTCCNRSLLVVVLVLCASPDHRAGCTSSLVQMCMIGTKFPAAKKNYNFYNKLYIKQTVQE